jgi:hypothetical protein
MKNTSKLQDGFASKLTLHRLTLRHLAATELDGVRGGVYAGKLPPPPSETCLPDLPTK